VNIFLDILLQLSSYGCLHALVHIVYLGSFSVFRINFSLTLCVSRQTNYGWSL